MKKGIFVLAIFSLFFFFSNTTFAFEPDGYVCDGCSDAAYESLVKSKYAAGVHYAYVFDTIRWKVTKWEVTVEREGGVILKFATEQPVENSVTIGFSKYQDLTEALMVPATTFPIDVPGSWYDSAFQVVGDVNAYNDLYNLLYENTSWFGWTTNWMASAMIDLTNKLGLLASVVILNFDDGSTLTLKMVDFDISQLGYKFEYQYAEDANGNVIPDSMSHYSAPDPVGWRVGEYIGHEGYTAVDQNGLPYYGWSSSLCYGVSCAINPTTCTVVETQCP